MGFAIKVDGQKVHEVDIDPQLVTGVSVRTSKGESAVIGFDLNDASIDLVVQYQLDTTLPVIEDRARQKRSKDIERGRVTENLYPNENVRRIEGLKTLEANQAERSAASSEDLSIQFAVEQEALLRGELDLNNLPETEVTPVETEVEFAQ